MHTARSLPPYVVMAALFPGDHVPFSSLPFSLKEAYDFHTGLLARPGFGAMLDRLEREDLLTLPSMLATAPFDLLRIRRKFRDGTVRLPVTPPDDFPLSQLLPQRLPQPEERQPVAAGGADLRVADQRAVSGLQSADAAGGHRSHPGRRSAADPGCRLRHCGLDSASAAAGRGHAITAVDLSPAYLRYARLAQRLGFRDNTRFLQMNAESLCPR